MIQGFSLLLLFQLLGEATVRLLQLPVPGPVAGMALLLLGLLWRGGPGRRLAQAANHLLQHLSLLFVPAGTGLVAHLSLLRAEWLPISVSLLFSTVLTMAVTAWCLHRWHRQSASSVAERDDHA